MEELLPKHIQEIEANRIWGNENIKPEPLLYWKNTVVAVRENIMVITGKKKSRKSRLSTCIGMGRFIDDPDKTLHFNWNVGQDEVILHFDTEMSRDLTLERKEEFQKMCGIEYNDERYMVYNIDKYDYQEKIDIIDFKVSDLLANGKTICCLLIDQVADLLMNRDVNYVPGVEITMEYLLRWKRETRALVMPIIHTNRAGLDTNGQIGVQLDNKMDSQLRVIKEDEGESLVKCITRRKPIPDFKFTQNEWGEPMYVADEEDIFF